MRPGPRHLLVAGFFALHLALAVRGGLRDDDRYAWRMFSGTTQYRLRYTWFDAAGQPHAYTPGDELRGHARAYLQPHIPHRGFYGLGATRDQIHGYLEYLLAHRLIDATRVEAELTYRRGPDPQSQHETLEATR